MKLCFANRSVAMAALVLVGACTTPEVPTANTLSVDDIPEGAEPITTFNGEWLSEQFAFAFRIDSRIGTATLVNPGPSNVGDIVLIITDVDGMKFDGQRVFSDGSIHTVIGRLVTPGLMSMTGAGLNWTMVLISTPNAEPMVSAGEDQTVRIDAAPVQLVGLADDDGEPDGELKTEWSLVSGPGEVEFSDSFALATSVAFGAVGEYVLQLEADDGERVVADTVTITVIANSPPVANGGVSRNVVSGLVLSLDAMESNDPDGDPLTYLWSQIEGTPVEWDDRTAVQPTFAIPDEADTLVFSVAVDDGRATAVSEAVTLTVVTDPSVRLETSLGDVVVDVLLEATPVTSLNFLQYVEDGFYDGTIFHRVVPDFVVQGGGFLPGPDMLEPDGLRDPIVNEFSPDRSNVRGTVAMAKVGGDPDSATSQFFFNLADNSANLDNQNGGFTVFATVAEGQDVVDAMAEVELDGESPVDDIVISMAKIE